MTIKDILNKLMGEKQPTITNTIQLVINGKKPLPISKEKTKSKKKKLMPK